MVPHSTASRSGLWRTDRPYEELSYRHGGTRQVHKVYSPHRDAASTVVGVVVLITDISARKALEGTLALRTAEL